MRRAIGQGYGRAGKAEDGNDDTQELLCAEVEPCGELLAQDSRVGPAEILDLKAPEKFGELGRTGDEGVEGCIECRWDVCLIGSVDTGDAISGGCGGQCLTKESKYRV